MSTKKIGIMGGTFDPIHVGHLILGEHAYDFFGLDKVLFMPTGNPPHKDGRVTADKEHRINMCRLAISDNPHFQLSTLETDYEGYSYTCETLQKIKLLYPDTEIYFIIGADSLFSIEKWRNPQQVFENCILLVANREETPSKELLEQVNHLEKDFHASIQVMDTPNIDISSRFLRKKLEEQQSIKYYVTKEVEQYIKQQGLYQ